MPFSQDISKSNQISPGMVAALRLSKPGWLQQQRPSLEVGLLDSKGPPREMILMTCDVFAPWYVSSFHHVSGIIVCQNSPWSMLLSRCLWAILARTSKSRCRVLVTKRVISFGTVTNLLSCSLIAAFHTCYVQIGATWNINEDPHALDYPIFSLSNYYCVYLQQKRMDFDCGRCSGLNFLHCKQLWASFYVRKQNWAIMRKAETFLEC